MAIINKSLADALLDISTSPRDFEYQATTLGGASNPAATARSMLAIYSTTAAVQSKIDVRNRSTCETLLQVVDCRIEFQNNKKQACLAGLEKTGLVPLSPSMSIGAIKRLSYDFNQLDQNLGRIVPALLLMAVDCLRSIYQEVSSAAFVDATRAARITTIKKQAKVITLYAGLIRYNIDDNMTSWIMSGVVQGHLE